MAPSSQRDTSAQWLQPQVQQEGLHGYLVTLRERWRLILLALLVCVGAAFAYIETATKQYKATADVLVTPVSQSDQTTLGLGLISDSNDPTRDVSTAASLITTIPVAEHVRSRLHIAKSATRLLQDITAEPLAQSSIVSVTAQATSPAAAAGLANAFAQGAVDERTAQLRRQLATTIPQLQAQVKALPPAERLNGTSPLVARLAALQALSNVPDPTMRVVTQASPPDHPSSPRSKLAIAAAIFAGLILGLGGAFGLQALDPRIRREDQLRALFRLPILARIPREGHTRGAGALAPGKLSAATSEAYRTLRTTLAASRASEFRPQSVLVTGSSPSEGKSTTAINFAFSLVQAGHRVILIEADMRRPTIGAALGVRPRYGIGNVLVGQAPLEEALCVSREYGDDLQLLLVDRPEVGAVDRLSLPTARQLIHDAEALADFVVIDSPPLTEISDALPIAQEVADILVVVRLGHSRIGKLQQLGEMLAQHDLQPTGIALVGVDRPPRDAYYYASDPGAARRPEPEAEAPLTR